MKQRAFTLMELMIVIVIIGILALVGLFGFSSYVSTPTPSFDFPCYNECKERNSESFCRQKCSMQ